ncbi:unnamed protein product [Oikopleura dioica]|uniref:Uncharacterized protein n=1 Tax=Oikopleura dioica TaxID=34765 RepID=E4XC76_OIKDI|nr:unnamed protein product [Oikopleura dioica]
MEDEKRKEYSYQKCEELHGLAIYFEKQGKNDDALYVCKQILLEPAAYEQPEKELIVFVFQMCDFLCKSLGDEPQRRYFKRCENEYYKQILLARSDYNRAECDKIRKKTEDCKILARICEEENPELAILYLLNHREGNTEEEKKTFEEQLQRLMAKSGANKYKENFRQHSNSENLANIEKSKSDGIATRAPKILKRPGLKKRSPRTVAFKEPEITYSQEKFRRRMIKLILICSWTIFVFFAMYAFRSKLEENGTLYMLNKIRAIVIALGTLVIMNIKLPSSTEVIPQRKEKTF